MVTRCIITNTLLLMTLVYVHACMNTWLAAHALMIGTDPVAERDQFRASSKSRTTSNSSSRSPLLSAHTASIMSFRASLPRLAAQPLASSSSSSSSSAAARTIVNRAPPKHLRGKVKRAEAREAEYALRIAEAEAKGLPIPRFKPLVVPENLQWYKIGRSSGGELPVYTDKRADGGYKTILKRIEVSLE